MKASRIVIIWRYPGFFKVRGFEVSRIVISCRYPGSFIKGDFQNFISWRYPRLL